jgi:hypothetical protein
MNRSANTQLPVTPGDTSVGAENRAAVPSSRSAAKVSAIVSWAIRLAGMVTVGCCAYMMVATHSSLPFWDGWAQINYVADGGNPYSVDWLWGQYNEHRMPIPKLLLQADLHWSHARQIFLLASIFAIQFLQLGLLGWSMRVFGAWRGTLWRTGFGFSAFCLFCLSQWENLTWGMQVCFILPFLFGSVSFVGLLLYWKRSNESTGALFAHYQYLVLSSAAAVAATWCYLNGNLLWPLLIAAAILLRMRPIAILTYVIAGVLSTALFLNNYFRPFYDVNGAGTPWKTLNYLIAYFGSTWIGIDVPHSFRIAQGFGVLGALACVYVLLRTRSYIANRQPLDVQLVLTLLFCLGTGMMTSFGRSGFGVGQAFSSRYQSVALLFWCCLGLLLLSAASRRVNSSSSILLVQMGFVASILLATLYAGTPLIRARVRGFKLNAAGASLVSGVPDQQYLSWVYLRPEYLPAMVEYLRQNQLSVFGDDDSLLLGKPISVLRVAGSDHCVGNLESDVRLKVAANGRASRRLTGWAWDRDRNEAPAAILVVGDGVIMGVGALGDWNPVHPAHPWMAANFNGFTAYLRASAAAGSTELYGLVDHNRAACLIAASK